MMEVVVEKSLGFLILIITAGRLSVHVDILMVAIYYWWRIIMTAFGKCVSTRPTGAYLQLRVVKELDGGLKGYSFNEEKTALQIILFVVGSEYHSQA